MTEEKKMGRPKKKKELVKRVGIDVRCTELKKNLYKSAALERDMNYSEWVIDTLDNQAKKDIAG